MATEFNYSGIKAKLERLKANAPKALQAVGQFFVADAQQTIAAGGNGWPQWSPAYAKRVAGKHQILWDSGTLMRSLTVLSAGTDSVTVGSNVVYAAIQQFGGRGIPARPYFLLEDSDKQQRALNVFRKYLLKGVQ